MRPILKSLFLGGCLLTGLLILRAAAAVGLGAAEVHSHLNQPLDVSIPLLAVQQDGLDEIQVGLATAEDFARVGLERSMLLNGLTFTVLTAGNRPVVQVTSEDAIREPFLSFLVRVEWPQGQLFRQYTILLDPPLTAPATVPEPMQTAPLQPRETEPVERVAEEQPVPEAEPAPEIVEPSQESTAPASSGGEYGPVAAGETLWSIANATRPEGVSTNRMMLALLRTNPEAFYEQNVNALKRGAVLRIPSGEALDQMTIGEVLAQVRRQNALWEDYRLRQAETAPAVVEGGEPAPREPIETEQAQGARVELVPPEEPAAAVEADEAVAGVAETGPEAEVEALRQQLARTREELLAQRAQSGELDSRVIELEEQVNDLERLLELKSNELAALQDQTGTAEPSPAETETMAETGEAVEPALPEDVEDYNPFADEFPAPEVEEQATAGVEEAEQGPFLEPDSAGEDTVQEEAGQLAEAETEQAAEPVAPVSEPPPQRENWWDTLFSPLVLGIVALILIGTLVAVFLHRRREGDMAYEGHSTRERHAVADEEEKAGPPAAPYWAPAADEASSPPAAAAPPQPEAGEYDQLALRAALEENPDDADLRLQLLAHYAANGERDAFIAEAETLYAQLADPTHPSWREVRRMGEEVAPEHPLFGGEEDLQKTATEEIPVVEDEEPRGSEDEPSPWEVEAQAPAEVETDAVQDEPAREYDLEDLTDEPSQSETTDSLPEDTVTEDETPERELTEPALEEETPESFAPDATDDFSDQTMLGDEDAAATKLELAEAYLEMGDHEGARGMLEEVLQDGNGRQQEKARELLQRLI